MAYDENLAQRIRKLLNHRPGFTERKMFGGIGFLLHGNMTCGVMKDDLIVRVGPDQYEELLGLPNTRLFDITGTPMKGWLMISAASLSSEDDLTSWVERGIAMALSLPPE